MRCPFHFSYFDYIFISRSVQTEFFIGFLYFHPYIHMLTAELILGYKLSSGDLVSNRTTKMIKFKFHVL